MKARLNLSIDNEIKQQLAKAVLLMKANGDKQDISGIITRLVKEYLENLKNTDIFLYYQIKAKEATPETEKLIKETLKNPETRIEAGSIENL